MQPGAPCRSQSAGHAAGFDHAAGHQGMLDFGRFGGPATAGAVQGMLDFGRFTGPPAPGATQGTAMGFPQPGFLEEAGYAASSLEEAGAGAPGGAAGQPGVAFGGAPQPGSYGPYGAGGQPQAVMGSLESLFKAGFGGGFPTSKPPTFPPPQPPTGRAADPAAASGGQQSEAMAPPSSASSAGCTGHAMQAEMGRTPHSQPPPPPSQAPHVPPSQPPAPQGPPPMAPPLMFPPAQPTRPGEASEEELRREDAVSEEAEQEARQKYGLLGILKVLRMTDPDLNTLALGMDLTAMGLDLNSPMDLYARFASPWTSAPARTEPEFYLPPSYYINPPALKTAYLGKFSLETLFYIFFNMPRDTLQAYAAAELYNRGWKHHRELNAWFFLQEEEGQRRWVCFDPITWEKHYYQHPVDVMGFLSDDDVNMQKMPQSQGGAPSAPPAA